MQFSCTENKNLQIDAEIRQMGFINKHVKNDMARKKKVLAGPAVHLGSKFWQLLHNRKAPCFFAVSVACFSMPPFPSCCAER